MWPAQGNIVKSFGPNNKGVDISGKEGDSVVASADGKVIVVGNMTNFFVFSQIFGSFSVSQFAAVT